MRLYPKHVYIAALDELKSGGFANAGEHPHPQSYKGADGNIHYRTSIPNSAVKFRDAYIDEMGNVWAEYKTLLTDMGKQVQEFIDNGLPIGFSNRMTGQTVKRVINDSVVEVAKVLKLYTWDVVLSPAENESFSTPICLTDDILNEEDKNNMDFFNMTLEQLKEWKKQNGSDSNVSLCDQVIAVKEAAKKAEETAQALTDELKKQKEKEASETKKQEAQKELADEVEKLVYDEKTKKAIIAGGKGIQDLSEVKPFLDIQMAIVDSVAVAGKLGSLGVPAEGGKQNKAVTTPAENNQNMALIDSIMSEMDRELLKKNSDFKVDNELRKSNRAIIDGVMKQLERGHTEEYLGFMKTLNDEASLTDGVSIGSTGQFAQSTSMSLAILYQAWQDVKFLQLCMTEGFGGTTYKMPVEFQSYDLFTEEDFAVGELEGIPTESIQTFMLEFGAQWLKRGFVVTKEAEKEMKTSPMRYDVVAGNAASIANRFNRIIDKMISTEMISRADEYKSKRIKDEAVAASELEAITAGLNAPEETNAAFRVKLLCGRTSPLSALIPVPPVVRPRVSVWLDTRGRKQEELINEVIVKDSGNSELIAGAWISSKGRIVSVGGRTAQYAVDYENSCIYFVKDIISASALPKITYSYATNVSFFNLSVPTALADFPARYYNSLVEMIDVQKAYMGSSPRYVTPDFVLGSLNAMVPLKQAELFYQRALPEGTSLLGGEMYFARRNGVDFAEHNSPWVAGDSRLLLGKRNAVRVGMGSPYDLEGPFPHISDEGNYTSAKEYFVTQQIAVNTPLVIDETGEQYHPPFRTIKYYTTTH